jgi:hypothetical protein
MNEKTQKWSMTRYFKNLMWASLARGLTDFLKREEKILYLYSYCSH